MPIYFVIQTFPAKPEPLKRERLIDAPNKAAAIRFVANDTIDAQPVEIEDAMRLAKAGVAVEKEGE